MLDNSWHSGIRYHTMLIVFFVYLYCYEMADRIAYLNQRPRPVLLQVLGHANQYNGRQATIKMLLAYSTHKQRARAGDSLRVSKGQFETTVSGLPLPF